MNYIYNLHINRVVVCIFPSFLPDRACVKSGEKQIYNSRATQRAKKLYFYHENSVKLREEVQLETFAE